MSVPLNALIIEDSEDDAELLLLEMRRSGYVVTYKVVETAEAMRAALEERAWDVVLSDYVLPRFDGMEALRVLKQSGQDLPFLIISGTIGEDIAVAAMRAGAHDYLMKGKLARLGPAIDREMREAEQRRLRRQADEALRSRVLALTQPTTELTGLNFSDLFDLDEIQQIQDSFAEATGVGSMITDVDGRPITRPSNFCSLCEKFIRATEVGRANCKISDAALGQVSQGGPAVQRCLSGGLMDGSARIYLGNHHIANWLVGQVLEENEPVEHMVAYADQIGVDRQEYRKALNEVRRMPREKFEKVMNFLYHNANLLSRMALQNVLQARAIVDGERSRIEIDQKFEQLMALRQIDSAINSSRNLDPVIEVLAAQAVRHLQAESASVLIFQERTNTLRIAAAYGPMQAHQEPADVVLSDPLAGRVFTEQRTITSRLDDVKGSPRAAYYLQAGFQTYFGTPMISNGKVKGVLELLHSDDISVDQKWLEFYETLAGQAAIAVDNVELFHSLQQSNAELLQAYDATIEGWSRAMDLRDRDTEGHSQRVTCLTVRLARAMGMSDSELACLRRGALLHDIGKMGVPDQILNKPGPLTPAEWAVMRRHPVFAYEMLSPIDYLKQSIDIPYYHHEKWDGTGYPNGLKGEAIPLVARIFAVVDVWDALSSDRPYRPAWTQEAVKQHLMEQSGTHFDPRVVEEFLRVLETNPL